MNLIINKVYRKVNTIVLGAIFCMLLFNVSIFSATDCPLKRAIKVPEMNWLSANFSAEVMRLVFETGYSCKWNSVPGTSAAVVVGFLSQRFDISTEWWWVNSEAQGIKGSKEGKMVFLGPVLEGKAGQGTYIPRYLQEANPGLKSFSDLKKYKHLFKDPEEPSKGRYYPGITGWYSTIVFSNQKIAYLGDDFNNFEVGDPGMLKAAIKKAFAKKKGIAFGWWEPDAMMAQYDLVKLEEPEHDSATFECLKSKDCENPVGSAWADTPLLKMVTLKFFKEAPTLAAQVSHLYFPAEVFNDCLKYGDKNEGDAAKAAAYFFKTYPKVWKAWNIPKDAQKRIEKKLKV